SFTHEAEGWAETLPLQRPTVVLQDNAVAVWVLEGNAAAIPIGIKRRDRLKPCAAHPRDRRAPGCLVRKVKHNEVVLCQRSTAQVSTGVREFEVIRYA